MSNRFCFHFILIESNERKYFLFYHTGHENEQIKFKNLFVSIHIKSGHNIDTTSAESIYTSLPAPLSENGFC